MANFIFILLGLVLGSIFLLYAAHAPWKLILSDIIAGNATISIVVIILLNFILYRILKKGLTSQNSSLRKLTKNFTILIMAIILFLIGGAILIYLGQD